MDLRMNHALNHGFKNAYAFLKSETLHVKEKIEKGLYGIQDLQFEKLVNIKNDFH